MGDVTQLPQKARPAFVRPSPITSVHDASNFFSSHQSLTDWLKNTALKAEGRTARTYVVCEAPHTVVGYYSIAMGSVARIQAPGKVRKNSPEPIPVAILARLAVAKHMEGQGIGGGMLQDAFQRILMISESIGCRAILVHAVDGEACSFYDKFGFTAFPSGTKTLFLPIETLRAAI